MNKIYPELHDILKLLECPLLHDYPEVLSELRNSPIFSTLKHHKKENKEILEEILKKSATNCKNPEVFLNVLVDNFYLSLADSSAANIARMEVGKYKKLLKSYKLFKLWKDSDRETFYKGDDAYPQVECPQIKEYEKGKWKCLCGNPIEKIIQEGDIWKCDLIRKKELIKKEANFKNEDVFGQLFEVESKFLKQRAEDTAGECPFASLYTHCLLTEVWYKFFKENQHYFKVDFNDVIKDGEFYIPNNQSLESYERNIRDQLLKNKRVTLLRIKLHTYVKLARLRDTKIINGIPEALKEIKNELKASSLYHVGHEKEKLFRGDEAFLVIAQDNKETVEATIKEILHKRYHYYADVISVTSLLCSKYNKKNDPGLANTKEEDLFDVNYNKLFDESQIKRLSPEFPLEIHCKDITDKEASKRIICDLCQMEQADDCPDDQKDDPQKVKEYLGQRCLEIRNSGGVSSKIAEWEKEGENEETRLKLGLVLISLNMDKAFNVLNKLLKRKFAKNFEGDNKLEKSFENPFSPTDLPIFNEFLVDYSDFLVEFKEKIFKLIPEDNRETEIEKNWNNLFLFCQSTDGKAILADILNEFYRLHHVYFPELEESHDNEHPITLSMTYSNIKYPFYKHWDMLTKDKKKPINVYLINSTKLETDFNNFESLRKIKGNERISTFLHRVAIVEQLTGSNILTTIEFAKHRPYLEPIFKPMELSLMNEILPYYKIQRS